MSNPSKRKGQVFESCITEYLRENWSDNIERLPTNGVHDRGDVANFRVGNGRHLVAWELKNRTQMSLGQWIAEAQREAKEYGAVMGGIIHKRKGKGAAGDQWVTLTLSDLLVLLHAAAS